MSARGSSFSFDDKKYLVDLVREYKDIILSRSSDSETSDARSKAWQSICDKYNASGRFSRSKSSIEKTWDNLKHDAKKYIKTQNKKRRSANSSSEFIMEQVTELLKSKNEPAFFYCEACKVSHPAGGDSNCSPANLVIDESRGKNEERDIDAVIAEVLLDENAVAIPSRGSPPELIEVGSPTPLVVSSPITPMKRKRQSNRTDSASTSITIESDNISQEQKKIDLELLKGMILREELQFKRKLYNIQLKVAEKELEIKEAVLRDLLNKKDS